ncbi:hypothetical protein [Streptomyces niveus]|uniref:hypothetical protein n=1 Tax=Streptomyces niveus TaxID=193462 RepID=UPI0034416AAE
MAERQHPASTEDAIDVSPRRWQQPDPSEVDETIAFYTALSDAELTEHLAAFIAQTMGKGQPTDFEILASAFRSQALASRARDLLRRPAFQEPDRFLPRRPDESRRQLHARRQFWPARVKVEERLLTLRLDGPAARREEPSLSSTLRGEARRALSASHSAEYETILRVMSAVPLPEFPPVEWVEPNPKEVARAITILGGIDGPAFSQQVAELIDMRASNAQVDGWEVRAAAIRSDEHAFRARKVLREIKKSPESYLERDRSPRFEERADVEAWLLERVVNSAKAVRGMVPLAPNPHARAEEALARKRAVGYLKALRAAQQRQRDARASAGREARAERQRAARSTR